MRWLIESEAPDERLSAAGHCWCGAAADDDQHHADAVAVGGVGIAVVVVLVVVIIVVGIVGVMVAMMMAAIVAMAMPITAMPLIPFSRVRDRHRMAETPRLGESAPKPSCEGGTNRARPALCRHASIAVFSR